MSGPTVRLIGQCVDRATLLVDNVSKTVSIGKGVVVYVCFLAGANDTAVDQAIVSLLQSKIFHLGPRNDEEESRPKPFSIAETPSDVLVVPQATLAGKIKGKCVQYHGQVGKDEGLRLYKRFVSGIRGTLAPGIDLASYDPNGLLHDSPSSDSQRLILNGTYGNRQGLQIDAYGPFTHLIEI